MQTCLCTDGCTDGLAVNRPTFSCRFIITHEPLVMSDMLKPANTCHKKATE